MKNGLPSWRGWKNRAKMDSENRKNRRKTGKWQEFGYVFWAAAQGSLKGDGRTKGGEPTRMENMGDCGAEAAMTGRGRANAVRPYGGGDLCGHYGSSRRILARTAFAPTVAGVMASAKGGESTRMENMGDCGAEAAMTGWGRGTPLRWREFMRTLRFKPTNFGQNCVRPYGGGDLCGHYGSSRRILARTASDRVLTLSKSVAWM